MGMLVLEAFLWQELALLGTHTHCAVKVVLMLTKAFGQFACLIQLVVHF